MRVATVRTFLHSLPVLAVFIWNLSRHCVRTFSWVPLIWFLPIRSKSQSSINKIFWIFLVGVASACDDNITMTSLSDYREDDVSVVFKKYKCNANYIFQVSGLQQQWHNGWHCWLQVTRTSLQSHLPTVFLNNNCLVKRILWFGLTLKLTIAKWLSVPRHCCTALERKYWGSKKVPEWPTALFVNHSYAVICDNRLLGHSWGAN